MSDLKGRALLLSGRAVFLSRKPGWSDKLQDEIEEALRDVQRETAQKCSDLHESVNPASDYERHKLIPGAGAMGAVIQYRDLIKARFGLDKDGE